MNFHRYDNGSVVNLDQVAYVTDDAVEGMVNLHASNRTIIAVVPKDEFEKSVKSKKSDAMEAANLFARAVRDFSQAVLRIPTSIRTRF